MRLNQLLILLILTITFSCKQQVHPELRDYVSFIQKQNINATNYIIDLWKVNDIVILCERYHGEITQYDLIFDLIKSDYFVQNVGNIFTEIGSISVQDDFQKFLHNEYLDSTKRNKDLINLYRNIAWPYWEKSNFYFFLQDINILNSKLSTNNKIDLYPSDIVNPVFSKINSKEDYLTFKDKYHKTDRDSIMAKNIIHVIDSLNSNNDKKCKSLIIMNYRHAFSKHIHRSNGEVATNTSAIIYNHYKDKVANVYINSLALTEIPVDTTKNIIYRDYTDVPIQQGKWDASFKISEKENIGFNFKGSPFGIDSLDIWPWSHQYTYEDIFTGFVFYMPLGKHIEAFGIDNYVDSSFVDELFKRISIFNDLYGGNRINKVDLMEAFNYEESKYDDLGKLEEIINSWIE